MNDWGTPNWRDASAYPPPEAPIRQWRWEFMRRRPDYRNDWLDCYEQGQKRERCARAKNIIKAQKHSSEKINKNSVLKILEEMELEDKKFIVPPGLPCPDVASKYGMRRMYDPSDSRVPFPLINYILLNESKAKGVISVKVDLYKPIDAQLASIGEWLKSIQSNTHTPKIGKANVKLWPLYLRVIDARDSGATNRDIFETLTNYTEDMNIDEYDRLSDIEPKDWVNSRHRRAMSVAYKFPR